MQINVHEFTLTGNGAATINVTSDSATLHELPTDVIFTLATTEALDLTGVQWAAAGMEAAPAVVPGHRGYAVNLRKL